MSQTDPTSTRSARTAVMNKKNRALIYRVMIYFLGNICSKLITFLLTRLQTGALEPKIFGPANLLVTTLPQLVSICFFEIWSGALRFMYDGETEKEKHKVFTNTLVASAFLFPLFVAAVFLLNYSQQTPFFFELALMGVVYLLDYLYQFTARGLGRNKLFAITGIISSFVLGITQYLFLNVWKLGAVSLILSVIAASTVSILIYELSTRQLLRCRPREVDFRFIRSLLRFSFPLSINATAFVALTKFNEFYVQRNVGNSALGLLAAANKIAMIVNIFITVFSLAWQETAFSMSTDKDRAAYFSQTLRNYVKLLGVGTYVLIAFGRLFFDVIISGNEYDQAYWLIPVSIIAVAISAISNFMGHIYSAEKKNDQLFYSTLVGAVTNIVFMLLLLVRVGLQAANIALALGFGATFIYRYLRIQQTVQVELPRRQLTIAALGILFNSLIFFLLPQKLPTIINMVVSAIVTCFVLRNELLAMIGLVLKRRGGRPGHGQNPSAKTNDDSTAMTETSKKQALEVTCTEDLADESREEAFAEAVLSEADFAPPLQTDKEAASKSATKERKES